MKKIIISLIVLALVLTFGIWNLNKIQSSSDQIIRYIQKLESHIYTRQWDEALSEYKNTWSLWCKHKSIWMIMIDHFEIDQIETSFAKLKVYIEQQQQTESLAEISSLKILIKHIPSKEAVTLKNIF